MEVNMRAVAELTEIEETILGEALAVYPHVNKRAFYRALMVAGCRQVIAANGIGKPIAMETLFAHESEPKKAPAKKASAKKAPAKKASAKRGKLEQMDLTQGAE
jgi:hypothetical protein